MFHLQVYANNHHSLLELFFSKLIDYKNNSLLLHMTGSQRMARLTQVVNAADYGPGSPASQRQREEEKGDWVACERDGP